MTAVLPGRALDIVLAAAAAAGARVGIGTINLHDTSLTVHLSSSADRSEGSGRAVLAQLGVVDGITVNHGTNHSALDVHVPALGWTVRVCVDLIQQPITASDPTALIVHVDATRAADEARLAGVTS